MLDRWVAALASPSRGLRVVGWSLLLAASVGCVLLQISALWLFIPIIVVLAGPFAYEAVRDARLARRRQLEEPIDEWIIELDGADVGRLIHARFTDMFWKRFTVTGRDQRLFDESLWRTCRFTFRHAISGRRAPCAHFGGRPPTRHAPRVSMRSLA